MDTLRTHLSTMSRNQQAEFAQRCGTSIGYLRNIICGFRTCSEALAMAIEEESGGKVTVEELRPDLIKRWTYIRGTAKQPPPLPMEQAA